MPMRPGFTIMILSLNRKACSGSMTVLQSTSPLKFKMQASAGKIMCTVFWDAEGIMLIDYICLTR